MWYGLRSYGLHSYGLCGNGLYSYDLYSSGDVCIRCRCICVSTHMPIPDSSAYLSVPVSVLDRPQPVLIGRCRCRRPLQSKVARS